MADFASARPATLEPSTLQRILDWRIRVRNDFMHSLKRACQQPASDTVLTLLRPQDDDRLLQHVAKYGWSSCEDLADQLGVIPAIACARWCCLVAQGQRRTTWSAAELAVVIKVWQLRLETGFLASSTIRRIAGALVWQAPDGFAVCAVPFAGTPAVAPPEV
jgi:hypothetical protein